MNIFSISIQLSIIGCKIIHLYSPFMADNKLLEFTQNARHRFGVDVWTNIIRQAVERLTEKEIFMSILQNGYEFMAEEGADPSPFINFIDLSLNNFLAGELKLSQQKLLSTKDCYNETFIHMISNSLTPVRWTEFQFTPDIVMSWHNSEHLEHHQPFQRLCIIEEILFQKIFCSAGFPSLINDQTVTESELVLYDKLKRYLRKDVITLWETYASNEAVSSIAMDLTSIMLDNHRANCFFKIMNKNLHKDDIIVCLYVESDIISTMERITIGKMQLDTVFRYSEGILENALKAFDSPVYRSNCTKFRNSITWNNKELVVVLEKRYLYDNYDNFTEIETIGNSVEQKLWIELHQKMKEMFKTLFEPMSTE